MLSNTDARVALLAAADHLESTSGSYNFSKTTVPRSLRDNGCMVGWACYFSGKRAGGCWTDSEPLFGRDPATMWHEMLDSTAGAMNFRGRAAVALRRYADKNHPLLDKYSSIAPVWAQMLDREAAARKAAQPAYERFRQGLVLESVPQGEPGNSVPSNEPVEEDEVL